MCGEEGTWEISASSSHFSHESLNKSAKLNTQQQFIYIFEPLWRQTILVKYESLFYPSSTLLSISSFLDTSYA